MSFPDEYERADLYEIILLTQHEYSHIIYDYLQAYPDDRAESLINRIDYLGVNIRNSNMRILVRKVIGSLDIINLDYCERFAYWNDYLYALQD